MSSDSNPPYANGDGQTVGVSDSDGDGDMETDIWPSDATDRDDLSDDQIKVIEAAVCGEWNNASELTRTIFDVENGEHTSDYGGRMLRKHCPRLNDKVKDSKAAHSPAMESDDSTQTEPQSEDSADGGRTEYEISATVEGDTLQFVEQIVRAVDHHSVVSFTIETDSEGESDD